MSLWLGIALQSLPGPRLRRSDLPGLDLVTHLLHTMARHPEPVVAHAVESFFAPHMDTVGCVGIRGSVAVRQVLTNGKDFAPLQPDIGALPADVQRMSRGVFTFHGDPHAELRSALREVLGLDAESEAIMRSAVRNAFHTWRDEELELTGACRAVAREVLGAILFGPGEPGREIAHGVGRVVDARRAGRLASTAAERSRARRQIIQASRSLAARLRHWLGSRSRQGQLAALGQGLRDDPATTLAVAHATAICAAATEPTAASLAWAVLALTQRPDVQAAIRDDFGPAGWSAAPSPTPAGRLLDRVVSETQRLFPSSAIVTRATVRPVEVAGWVLPERCEVMVSSLLAQRDPSRFPEPSIFAPDRWLNLRVTPFEFFPFGSGVRACLGAALARAVLTTSLAELVGRGTVSLPFDTQVGWQMPDALLPSSGIPIVMRATVAGPPRRVRGPLCEIADFATAHP